VRRAVQQLCTALPCRARCCRERQVAAQERVERAIHHCHLYLEVTAWVQPTHTRLPAKLCYGLQENVICSHLGGAGPSCAACSGLPTSSTYTVSPDRCRVRLRARFHQSITVVPADIGTCTLLSLLCIRGTLHDNHVWRIQTRRHDGATPVYRSASASVARHHTMLWACWLLVRLRCGSLPGCHD